MTTSAEPTPRRSRPPGWRWVRLGDVTELLPSKSVATDGDALVQAITTACLSERGFLASGLKSARMRASDVPECVVAPGEVLIARSNTAELVGRAAVFKGSKEPVVATDLTIRMWPREGLAPDFLSAYLSFLFVSGFWRQRAGGASGSMKKITRTQLTDLEMPLPSAEEQRRLTAVLSTRLPAVERARAAAEAQLQAAKALPVGFLHAVFSGDDARGWLRVRLGELSSDLDAFADGPFGSNLKTEHYVSAGARVVRLQNIGRGAFLDADKSFISLDRFAGLHRHSVRPGDVVVAALGDGARPAGRACVIPDDFGPGLVKADCFRLRLPADSVLALYLAAYLNSPVALSRVADTMRGATRPRMTLAMLRTVAVPLAPVPQQREIVRKLNVQLAAVERVRQTTEDQLAAINAMPAALLRRAFSGAL